MSGDQKSEVWLSIIAAVVIGVMFLAMLPRWIRGDEERSVLAQAGYTRVKLTGFRVLGCPDLFGMGFEASGPTGVAAKGVVCKGILEKATIRLAD
ncbi:hypothetical protein [Paraburkholderia sp. SIMBA_054]|uniref:hypothetical protein n=1 Tax=Paraburkholderia sp. SIMBA_054 TaxID=3085795 RepID=UPI003978ACD9